MRSRRPPGKKRKQHSRELTPREALFVIKVLELENQTEAYLRAGYRCSRRTARVNAARLLTKASVQTALAIARLDRLKAAEMTADDAMRRLSVLARADIRRLFGSDDQLLPPGLWPEDIAQCVKSIRQRSWGIEVLLHDKLRALELIATAGGRIRGRHEHHHVFDHAAYLMDVPPPGDDR
ncbi:MAG: terminase small subunit [Vicinamibacterales bacterium]